MSTVQKVFIVLVFALAVTFTGLSLQMLSTEQHWKDQFVAKEKDEKEYVCDLYKNKENDKFWPHDSIATAIYFCEKCAEPTVKWNQA